MRDKTNEDVQQIGTEGTSIPCAKCYLDLKVRE